MFEAESCMLGMASVLNVRKSCQPAKPSSVVPGNSQTRAGTSAKIERVYAMRASVHRRQQQGHGSRPYIGQLPSVPVPLPLPPCSVGETPVGDTLNPLDLPPQSQSQSQLQHAASRAVRRTGASAISARAAAVDEATQQQDAAVEGALDAAVEGALDAAVEGAGQQHEQQQLLLQKESTAVTGDCVTGDGVTGDGGTMTSDGGTVTGDGVTGDGVTGDGDTVTGDGVTVDGVTGDGGTVTGDDVTGDGDTATGDEGDVAGNPGDGDGVAANPVSSRDIDPLAVQADAPVTLSLDLRKEQAVPDFGESAAIAEMTGHSADVGPWD